MRQDLLREQSIRRSLRTVARAVAPFRRLLTAEAKATVPLETPPERQLQIDFGQLRVRVFLFVATLGYSRRCHVAAVRHERQSSWFRGPGRRVPSLRRRDQGGADRRGGSHVLHWRACRLVRLATTGLSKWVVTTALPRNAGPPFYEHLNRILGAAGFAAVVEGLCARFYTTMGRPHLTPFLPDFQSAASLPRYQTFHPSI